GDPMSLFTDRKTCRGAVGALLGSFRLPPKGLKMLTTSTLHWVFLFAVTLHHCSFLSLFCFKSGLQVTSL
ncbi:hypothetical protein GOODEAATRI_033091, partial [Goodea atripinnis]